MRPLSLSDDTQDDMVSLRRLARSLVIDAELADDLVQDVLALHRLEPAHSRLDMIKLLIERNRRAVGLAGSARRPTARPDDQHGSVLHALQVLTLDQREALVLVVVSGLSYDQCAYAVSVPRDVAASRLAAARAAFNAALHGEPTAPAHLRLVT